MALDISSFSGISSASSSLDDAKAKYDAAVEALKTAIDNTKNSWQGADADQYRKKTTEIVELQLKPFNEVLNTQVQFLSTVSAALTKTQKNIVDKLQ